MTLLHIRTSDQLAQAREQFARHAYHRVLELCEQELLCRPDNRAAQRLLKRTQAILSNRDVKRGMVFICLGVLAVLGALFAMHRTVFADLELKTVQVNSLIDDLGELRQENAVLHGMMEDVRRERSGLRRPTARSPRPLPTALFSVSSSSAAGEDPAFRDTFDVLFLGMNDGLTDTILVASIHPAREAATLFSVPRDLAVRGRRINEVYGRYGIEKLKDDIATITGLRPDRYVAGDFSVFAEAIDRLGGVTVQLDADLLDPFFPLADDRFTVFSLQQGEHHLDGKTALQYVRSRKTTSDFDRARRQQELLAAVRKQMQGVSLWHDRKALTDFFTQIFPAVTTDVSVLEAVQHLRNYQHFSVSTGHVLSTSNYLTTVANEEGWYLLGPRDGNYESIRAYVRELVHGV